MTVELSLSDGIITILWSASKLSNSFPCFLEIIKETSLIAFHAFIRVWNNFFNEWYKSFWSFFFYIIWIPVRISFSPVKDVSLNIIGSVLRILQVLIFVEVLKEF